MKLNLELLKEYIVYSNPKSLMKFKTVQEKEVWMLNMQSIIKDTTIEDLNEFIDIVDFNKDSGKLFAKIYSDKLSEVVKDVNLQQMSLIDIYNEITLRTEQFKTNQKAIELIINIIGSSICNFLRVFKDDDIIDLIKRNTEYTNIFMNFFNTIAKSYQDSEGKISYGLSEYTIKNCLSHFREQSQQG